MHVVSCGNVMGSNIFFDLLLNQCICEPEPLVSLVSLV